MSKFELTEEQKNIINTVHDKSNIIKVNAYAGSGKTSTIVELVKEIRKNDKESKILYLVFNRSMIQDSKLKFDTLDLNVDCYTTHGFALKRFTAISKKDITIMSSIDFSDYMKIRSSNYKYKFCKYKNIADMFNAFTLTYDSLDTFCRNLLEGIDYYTIDTNIKSSEIDLFKELYNYFIKNNKYLHGMYLKEYSCECNDKIQGYKYVFIDEAQDVSLLAMPIIKRIKCNKMYIVGDAKQKIYSFLKAVDVFDKFEGPLYPLSTSFRFNNEICDVANELLSIKYPEFRKKLIKNNHNITEIEDTTEKAILFRLNSTLFEYAVRLISELDTAKVKFMDVIGGNNSSGFDDTFSEMIYFYDQLLACNSRNEEKLEKFRSKFKITYSKTVKQYCDIAKKEGQNLYQYLLNNKSILSLDMAKFFNFFIINEMNIVELLEKVRASEDRVEYDKVYYLITAHRSKGLEWSHVKIADDAWSLASYDEAHLLYVACTRAKNRLEYQPVKLLLEEAKII